jgi:serine/threonine protein phosphatase PrpC
MEGAETLLIRCGSQTDIGKARKSNEDSYVANVEYRLFLVADGMGGEPGGDLASRIAASTVEEIVTGSDTMWDPRDLLNEAVRRANAQIYEIQRRKTGLLGMGTTLTILYLANTHYHMAHVGDSRCYLQRGGVVHQLTRDHSLVWPLYERGTLTKDDLSSHPQKNLITRSIGPHPSVKPDLQKGDVQEEDVFLLCSDGLSDVVKDEDISRLLSDTGISPQETAGALIQAANSAGGPDNITSVVVRLERGRD